MDQLQFVFSRANKWVLYRHASFWICWYLFQVYLYAFTPSPLLLAISFGARIGLTAIEGLFFIFPTMFLTYTLLYWIIPKMVIPARYLKATFWIIVLLFITAGLSALISLTILDYLRRLYFTRYFAQAISAPMSFGLKVFLAMMGGLRGSITIGGLAAAIKMMKYFYEKQQHALLLEKEKSIAELQSLKAQLHPHFLFNTLNNIYSHTQDTAPVAADMIIALSALLRYILYNCNTPVVKLEQEIKMIHEYIELEKRRYGNELEVSIQTPPNYSDLTIAPLLILPFVENCFKHGTSEVLERPWMSMTISLEGQIMQLKLINGKVQNKSVQTGGIGISNVRRRLELLYPEKFIFDIIDEEDVYIVNLKIELKPDTVPAQETNFKDNELTYI
ncbi:sensor histidine kinase [Pedobacter fastidiosus]|nr:histidine kinase [Pedobacter fastidiosus]